MPDYPCLFGLKCRRRGTVERACRYVHPDEPQWNQVQNKDKDRRDRSGDGHSRSSGAPVTSANTAVIPAGSNRWNTSGALNTRGNTDNGGPEKGGSSSSAWNFSGHKPRNTISGDSRNAQNSGSNQWGDWEDSNDKGKSKQNSSSTGGWGVGDGWGNGGGGGWGNIGGNSREPPLKNSGGGGWGALSENTDGPPKATSGSPWNSGGGWGGTSSSWNVSGSDGWGQPSGDKERYTKEKVNGPDSGGTQPPVPLTKTINSSQQKHSDLPPLQPTPQVLEDAPQSAGYVPTSAAATAPLSTSALFSPLAGGDSFGKSTKEALEIVKLDPFQEKMKLVKYHDPAGRKTLYIDTIKHSFNAVSCFAELEAFQDELDVWRRTQNSDIYSHATMQTRKVLDFKKSGLTQQHLEKRGQLQKEINNLINLPDIGKEPKRAHSLTKEVIAAYTQELQAWFEDLQLHKRLSVEKDNDAAAQGSQRMEEGQIAEPEFELKISDLRERVKVTWKELRQVTEILEQEFLTLQEDYDMNVSTRIEEEKGTILSDLESRLDPDEQEEPLPTMDISTVSQFLEGVGNEIEGHAGTLASLLERERNIECKLEELRLERKEVEMLSDLANRYFAEEEIKSLETKVAELTEHLKSLYLHEPSSASGGTTITVTMASADSSSTLPSLQQEPIEILDLLESVRPLVIEMLRQEFLPVSEILRQRCTEYQEQLQEKLQLEKSKILNQVQDIKSKIGSSSSVFIPTIPQVQPVGPQLLFPPPIIPTLPPSSSTSPF